MQVWETRIQAGNRAFAAGAFHEAVESYRKACERAEVLFQRWFDYRATVAALVVSYHNLADTYVCLHQQERTLATLRDIQRLLIRHMNRPGIVPAKQRALLDGCHRTREQISLTVRHFNPGGEAVIEALVCPFHGVEQPKGDIEGVGP